jgi:hypothetical protein
LPKEKQQKEQIKVTDKRIFTPDGELREEFRGEITPSDPVISPPPAPEARAEQPVEKTAERRTGPTRPADAPGGERRKTVADRAENPGTPFTNFIEQLIVQGYVSLGMLRHPQQPQPRVDAAAARQMIEIISLLQEKTAGNLTPEEEDFLSTHLGELKLAFVQKTKTI